MSGRIRTVHCRAGFRVLVIGAGLVVAGCGAVATPGALPGGSASAPLSSVVASDAVCSRAPAPEAADTLIVLDWTGGSNRHAPGRVLAGFELSALAISDAADRASINADAFRADVLARVRTMLCALDPMTVAVVDGEAEDHPGATVVHITGDEPAEGGKQIGQSDFDPCNRFSDDGAIIWAGAMARRIPEATYDQWVMALANATTHEIGHTLGFFHPTEADLARTLPGNPSAEVMRKTTSISELLSPQAFLIEQDTCPGGDSFGLVPVDALR